jgi:hypothetical protein
VNKHLELLMLEAGYAAPHLAGRAHKLAALLINDCAKIANWAENDEEWTTPVGDLIKLRFAKIEQGLNND